MSSGLEGFPLFPDESCLGLGLLAECSLFQEMVEIGSDARCDHGYLHGVLIVEVEVEELVPLAYIYTIMVAFQGVSIFLILVAFSKQVRDAYAKWWMSKVNESDFLSKYFSTSLSQQTVSFRPPSLP